MKIFTVLVFTAFLGASWVSADETAGDKVENTYEEAKKDTKKTARKGKRKVRNATGNKSVTEDIKDSAKNTGDELSFQGEKLKNKAD